MALKDIKAANNAKTELAQAISPTDTAFIVKDAGRFPEAPFRITIDSEIMEVGKINKSANTLSEITRGIEGTIATNHELGASVENRWTAGTLQVLLDNIQTTFTQVVNGKKQIAAAIGDMNQSVASDADFEVLAAKIRDISKDANAVVGDVLTGKTFYQGGSKKTGTMANRGAKVYTPGTSNITIPKGYHNGSGYVKGDTNLKAVNIVKGKSIFGVEGTFDKEVTKIQANILSALRLPGLPKGVSAITGRYKIITGASRGYINVPDGKVWYCSMRKFSGYLPFYVSDFFIESPNAEYLVLEIDLTPTDTGTGIIVGAYNNYSDKLYYAYNGDSSYTLIKMTDYDSRIAFDYAYPVSGNYSGDGGDVIRLQIPGASVTTSTLYLSAGNHKNVGTVPIGETWLVSYGSDVTSNSGVLYLHVNNKPVAKHGYSSDSTQDFGGCVLIPGGSTVGFATGSSGKAATVVYNIMKFESLL